MMMVWHVEVEGRGSLKHEHCENGFYGYAQLRLCFGTTSCGIRAEKTSTCSSLCAVSCSRKFTSVFSIGAVLWDTFWEVKHENIICEGTRLCAEAAINIPNHPKEDRQKHNLQISILPTQRCSHSGVPVPFLGQTSQW